MNDFITSLRLAVVSLVICSGVYPLIILGIATAVAPKQATGSLVYDADGHVVGSRLIAQSFTRPEYFWPRPSAVEYNASATGGSNLSPANPKITDRATDIIERLQPIDGQRVPADMVLASGSGMDPHITLSATLFQAERVAVARNMPIARVEELIRIAIDSPEIAALGGEPLINVLELNLALDREHNTSAIYDE